MSVRSLLAELEIVDADGVVVGGRNGVRFVFELVIDGLFTGPAGDENSLRFYSGPTIPDIDSQVEGVTGFRFAQAIVGVEPYQAKFDAFKGWVSAGATKVALRPTRAYPLDDLMVLVEGVPYQGELATEIALDAEEPFAVTFRDSHPDLWPAAGTLCVGLEVMRYEVDGGVMTIVERGAFGSPRQRHRVDLNRGLYPTATSKIIAWEGRPARLLLTVERGDGSRHPDSIELVAGFLDGPPTGPDPAEMQVVITPWTSALEKKIGGRDAFTSLQHGWKVFADGDVGRTFRVIQRMPRGAYAETPDAIAGDGVTLTGTQEALHAALFDIEARDGLHGVVELRDGSTSRVKYNGGEIELVEAPVGGAWTVVRNVTAEITREARFADDGDVAVRWPNAAQLAIATELQPRTHIAADAAPRAPSWIDVRLSRPTEGGATSLHCKGTAGEKPAELRLVPYWPDTAWYAIDVADPGDDRFTLANDFRDFGPDRRAPAPRDIPIDAQRGQPRAGRIAVPIRGVADAYWSGETYIHVENDRPFPAPPFTAQVTWDERGEQRATSPRIIAVHQASNIFAGVPGYLLETDPEDRRYRLPLGDWDGKRSVQIRASVNARDLGPGRLMLQLLTSRFGDQQNGPYDVLPFGAGIPYDRVAPNTFLGFPVDALISDVDEIDLTEDHNLGELIGGTLRAMRAHIVEHLDYDTGKRVLHLEAADLAVATEAVGVHIQDGRWHRRKRPGTSTDRRVVNRIDFETNFVDGKPTVTVQVIDDGLVNEAGGQEHSVTEKLRGVRIQPGAATTHEALLRSIADARFAQLGRPRRLIDGSLPATDMLRTSPGAVVLVDSLTTRDADGSLGVVGKAAQIVGWKLDPWRMSCEAILALGATIVRGYGPTLRVVGIVDTDAVIVASNKYTSPTNRRTGQSQKDVDYWHVGQRVRFIRPGVVPRKWPAPGAWATITDIDRDLDIVTFDVDHGFDPSRLGYVDLPKYEDALPADQARWCWIGKPADPVDMPAYTFRYI